MNTDDDDFAKRLRGAADENTSVESTVHHESGAASQRIGNYKLLQRIGEGGMGAVWMAEQIEPIKRRIALKLIKTGRDSKPIIARFEAERQALALMDHPSIAKILDGGTTESGQPYFVMELVQGMSITKYCDKHKLGLPERLALFTQVCNAIQHAHQKGIIHRDLKPANILVGVYDGKPVPKVIDFGLAKALDHQSKLTDKTLFTEFGAVVGTLQYMSPEQADLDAIDIDTRADIYALGVLLYELLTGSTPIEAATLKQLAVLKVLETIRETDPPRPSARLSSSSQHIQEISSNREIDPARLQTELRGDLDWIVMKALEKDRSRRYESASGFAADVERYLTDQPVVARPQSTAYKLTKFLKKNRGPVVAAGTMLFLLLFGLIGTSLALLEARRQTKLADISKLEAQAASKKAIQAEAETKERVKELEEITAFQTSQLSDIDVPMMGVKLRRSLLDQFQSQMTQSGRSEDEVAKEVLELEQRFSRVNFVDASLDLLEENIFKRAEKVIEDKYKDKPLLAAALLHAIGVSLRQLGKLESGESSLRNEVKIRMSNQGPDDLYTINAKSDLGLSLKELGKTEEAEPLYREAMDARRRILGNEHPHTLMSVNNMACFLDAQGNFSEAEPLYRESLSVRRRTLGNEHFDTLQSMNNMGTFLAGQGQYAEAESLLREALSARRQICGNEHPDTLTSINNLASFLKARGKFVEAEPLQREALESRRRVMGNEHPDTINSINNMAVLLDDQGQLSEAELLYLEAIDRSSRILGKQHPTTLNSISNLSYILTNKGKLSEAAQLCRDVLEARRRILGDEHPDTLNSINNMAWILESQGNSNEAEQLQREATEAFRRILGNEHPDTLSAIRNLAGSLTGKGNFVEAEPLHRESLEASRKILGDEHPKTLISINNMASFLESQGKSAEAEPLYREALTTRRRILGDEHPETLVSINNMASFLNKQGSFGDADRLYRESLDAHRRTLGNEHPNTLVSILNMATFLDDQSNFTEADLLYRESNDGLRRILGNEHPNTIVSICNMANFFSRQGKFAKAEPLFREAINSSIDRSELANVNLITTVNLSKLLNRTDRSFESLELLRSLKDDSNPQIFKELAESHRQLEQIVEVLKLTNEFVERFRQAESPQALANALRLAARSLNRIEDYSRAEPLARESLELATTSEVGGWELERIRSTLGVSLLGLGRRDEAKPLLESSCEGIERDAALIPIEIRAETVEEAKAAVVKLRSSE